jgi:hypothetical protein
MIRAFKQRASSQTAQDVTEPTGAGTPREFRVRASAWLFATLEPDGGLIVIMFAVTGDQSAALAVNIRPDPFG